MELRYKYYLQTEFQSSNMVKSRNFIITINNPDVSLQEWYDTTVQLLKPTWLVAQLEKGSNGTPHIQAGFGLPSPRHFTAIKKIFPRAHIEPAKSAWDTWKYCQKEDTRLEGPLIMGVAPA